MAVLVEIPSVLFVFYAIVSQKFQAHTLNRLQRLTHVNANA